jgi:hypothetical protein
MSSSATEVRVVRAQSVEVREDTLLVDFVDGRSMTVPIIWYPRLWYATAAERAHFELLDDGRYIHWPDLDEDLSMDGLVAGRRSGETPKSLKKWLASRGGNE